MKKKYCTKCFQFDGDCNDASNIKYKSTAIRRKKCYINDCYFLNKDNDCKNFISKEFVIIALLILSSALITLIFATFSAFL